MNPFKPTIASALKAFHKAIADLEAVASDSRESAEATEAEASKLDVLALEYNKTADEALRLSKKLTEVIK